MKEKDYPYYDPWYDQTPREDDIITKDVESKKEITSENIEKNTQEAIVIVMNSTKKN